MSPEGTLLVPLWKKNEPMAVQCFTELFFFVGLFFVGPHFLFTLQTTNRPTCVECYPVLRYPIRRRPSAVDGYEQTNVQQTKPTDQQTNKKGSQAIDLTPPNRFHRRDWLAEEEEEERLESREPTSVVDGASLRRRDVATRGVVDLRALSDTPIERRRRLDACASLPCLCIGSRAFYRVLLGFSASFLDFLSVTTGLRCFFLVAIEAFWRHRTEFYWVYQDLLSGIGFNWELRPLMALYRVLLGFSDFFVGNDGFSLYWRVLRPSDGIVPSFTGFFKFF